MARFGFFEMLRVQRQPPAPVVKRDLTSKTVVVTGANVGLGLEAAKHFASMNPARLILACRNKEKGEAALEGTCTKNMPLGFYFLRSGNYQAIREATGYNNSELWLLDLARFASVIEFSERFERDGGKIDILVANAAVALYEYKTTPEGWEETSVVSTCIAISIAEIPEKDPDKPSVYCALICSPSPASPAGCRRWV